MSWFPKKKRDPNMDTDLLWDPLERYFDFAEPPPPYMHFV